MATSDYGIAYLDLAGNRVTWSPSDTIRDNIRLDGTHFRDIVRMATLAISALCLLSFIAILMAVCCCGCCCCRRTSTYLPRATVWIPIFCMIGFFGIDIANRVFHELQKTVSSAYLGIDIAMGSLASIADGLLMLYLKKESPFDTKYAKFFSSFATMFVIIIYFLISIAAKGTQIWSLTVQTGPGSGDGGSNSGDHSDDFMVESVQIFQDLNTAASGIPLLFAIGFALFSIITYTLRKRLSLAVAILTVSFLVRNAVKFAFTLIYSQYSYVASLSIQLIHMAFYGLLSVIIYVCIILIAATQKKGKPLIEQPTNNEVMRRIIDEGINWQQENPQPNVYP